MNFLAHIYLSGEDEFVKIGNFIADSVRGNQYLTYPKGIQQGILLHRAIDTFTDTHPLWRLSKKRIFPIYGHYAAVIIDMYYDYFLAKNWNNYCDVLLETYAENFYTLLRNNLMVLPQKVVNFLPIMFEENWLVKYRSIEGLSYILWRMDQRTKGKSKMHLSINELQLLDKELQEDFTLFFKALEAYVEEFKLTDRFLLKETSL